MKKITKHAFDPVFLERLASNIDAGVNFGRRDTDALRAMAAAQRGSLDAIPVDAVRVLLESVGEDPDREGLVDTPRRVVKAWQEMTVGYGQDPAAILERDFDGDGYDEIICVPNVEFYSTCEHHLLPFHGVAHVGYLPLRRVVGLSKVARLVDCFARRLQIQEQLTKQVADAMHEQLRPRGVAVVVNARHMCMACRGVGKQKASMVTSRMTGVFRTNPSAKAEFFRLVELTRL